jgi:hypothetical protein
MTSTKFSLHQHQECLRKEQNPDAPPFVLPAADGEPETSTRADDAPWPRGPSPLLNFATPEVKLTGEIDFRSGEKRFRKW